MIDTFIQEIKEFTSSRKRTIIRICGHGASGKSTFAKILQDAYPEGHSQIIETDLYIISGNYSKDTFLHYEFQGQEDFYPMTACHPARHELSSLKRDLTMLRKGMDLLTADTDWLPEKMLTSSCPVTIVEGMTPTFMEADLFDLSLFFYTDADTELQRRLERDTTHRGRNPEFIKQTHGHRRKQYELYMQVYKDDFDMIVNQSGNDFKIEKQSSHNCRESNQTRRGGFGHLSVL